MGHSRARFVCNRLLVVAVLASLLVAVDVAPARASSLLWSSGNTFETFGGNEAVSIDTGTINYASGCPNDGFDDFFYAFADVYIVPSGSVTDGDTLTDVGGVPNTVWGASGGIFISELLGYTAPGGTIPAGTYAIVYDECQDGRLDGFDTVFDPAFEVVIPADVPPLPSSFFTAKSDARIEAQSWAVTCGLFELVTFLADNAPGPGTQKKAGELLEEATSQFSDLLSDVTGVDPVEGTKQICTNMVKRFTALANDPAEPDFRRVTTLTPRPDRGAPATSDPLVDDLTRLVDASVDQAALLEALVDAAERYQGADAAGDGDWALLHARDLRDYASLLADELADTSTAATAAGATLASDTRDLDGLFADFATAAGRWVVGDFSAEERRVARNLELDDADLAALSVGVLEVQVPYSTAALQDELDGIATENAALAASLRTLATDLDAVIADLDVQPVIASDLPVADAGGPYVTAAGTTLTLDGSSSSAPSGGVSYAWDLDGDGAFDDATGATAALAADATSPGLVGLRITDAAGRQDADYAAVAVTDANRAPVFTSTTPEPELVRATIGGPFALAVVVDDPDADAVTVTWKVDGVVAGTGSGFDWTPGTGDTGLHRITATADDGRPGGTRTVAFNASARPLDADGDGWSANTDCDDADAAVNPGMTEEPFNGVDDDCSAFTPDAGEAPIAEFGFDPATPAVGDAVTFEDRSVDPDGTVVAWAWTFGDGATSAAQNPTHTYAGPGTYTVTLQVTDDEAFLGTVSREITVVDPGAPRADFAVSTGPWFEGEPITFTDRSTDPDGTLVSWAWDFGDGSTSTLPSPTHTYAVAGDYEVTLTVTDNDGKSAMAVAALPVAEPTQPPVAQFDASATADVLGSVTFGNTSFDPDGDEITSFWDFGDGATSTDDSPTHAYSLPGEYTVRLVVIDAFGARDEATATITVVIPPTAPAVQAGPDRTVDEGSQLRLEAAGTGDTRASFADPNPGDTHTATIDWGDGSPIEAAAASGGAVGGTHTYADDGTYVAEVCVTDSSGLTGCDSFLVSVANLAPDVTLTDLNRWVEESYPAVGGFPVGDWRVADDGLTVTQVNNGQPTLFLSEFDVFNTEAVVNISVTGGDDDMIGFALGFSPGDTDNRDADYLLVDWKGSSQSFNFSETCDTPGTVAPTGLAVSRVTGVPTADELWGHTDFDAPDCSPLGEGLEELARASTLGSTGWVRNTEYEFRIDYRPDRLQIHVNGVLEFDVSGDFPPGRIGFYNFSQANVIYRAFDLEAAGGIEGTPLDLTASFSDDGVLDTHTGVFSWGDSTPTSRAVVVETDGAGTATSTHTYADDGTYPAQVCMTDDDDGTTCDDIEVRIANAAPVVEAGPDVTTAGAVSLSPATFTDAGVEDTHTATVTWGDGNGGIGTVSQGAGSGSVDASHEYAAAGVYTVDVCVTDDDKGTGCDAFTVTVSEPVAPSVADVEAGHTFAEGDEHPHWLSFDDADADASHTVTVDWGDGSPAADALVNETDGRGNAVASHVYGDNGSYLVTWEVCDDDGCTSTQVTEEVTNVAPATDAAEPIARSSTDTGELTLATYTDPGFDDTHTATVDWGDGSAVEAGVVTGADGSGSVTGTHRYPGAGTYTVEVCVTDDDGGVDCDTTSITVEVASGTIVIEKVSGPSGAIGFAFASDVAGHEQFSLDDGATRSMEQVAPGTYTVTESDASPDHVLADITCSGSASGDIPTRSATIDLGAGETVTCTFTNLATADIELTKLTDGVVDPTTDWNFVLFAGPDGFDGKVLAEDSTDGDADGVLTFGDLRLDPRGAYTICEREVPAGWSSQWRIDTDGDGTVDATLIAYNPDADDVPSQDLGNRCTDIGAGTSYPIAAGGTVALQVDNRMPGGDPRTPGYWKNWNSCTRGGQAANAARNGGPAAGWYLLDDILSDPGVEVGDLTVSTCEMGVLVLDQRDLHTERKRANDAAYTLAMHLLAAELNVAAGAQICPAAQDAIAGGQALLRTHEFNGEGRYLRSRHHDYERALALADTLDRYNNGLLCR